MDSLKDLKACLDSLEKEIAVLSYKRDMILAKIDSLEATSTPTTNPVMDFVNTFMKSVNSIEVRH